MGSGLLSPSHLAVVFVVALIVFGPKRLPELGRALGTGLRSFREAIGDHDDVHREVIQPVGTPAAAVDVPAAERPGPAPAAVVHNAPPAAGATHADPPAGPDQTD